MKFEQIEDYESIYAENCKDENYPCPKCPFGHDPHKCMDQCSIWKGWFRRKWREIQNGGKKEVRPTKYAKVIDYEPIYKAMCEDKNYPCQYCKKRNPAECGGCVKWRAWFKERWAESRKVTKI